MTVALESIERAIVDIKSGRAVVVVDDEDRENEGDLIFAAELATPELVAFMVRYTSGYICVPITEADADRLDLPPMFRVNQDRRGTAYAVTAAMSADPSGLVCGFADATGRFLPLACTLNAARVLDVTARLLGVGPAGLSDLALQAPAGADGLVLLPYLDGERTPNRPAANGVLRGLTTSNATPENLARAAVEAVICSLADAIDFLRPCGINPGRIVLTGGAARSEAVRAIAAGVFGLPVVVPAAAEYVALGAARQAAWALAGSDSPPSWPARPSVTYEASATPEVREQYGRLRDDAAAWQVTGLAGRLLG